MAAVVRYLSGDRLDFVAEVEHYFDITPELVDEATFEAAHAEMDRLLPGRGPLLDRLTAWKQTLELDPGAHPARLRAGPPGDPPPHPGPVRPAGWGGVDTAPGQPAALVGLQLVPGRLSLAHRHQHRPARSAPTRRCRCWPTKPTPATTPSTPSRSSDSTGRQAAPSTPSNCSWPPNASSSEGIADSARQVIFRRRRTGCLPARRTLSPWPGCPTWT